MRPGAPPSPRGRQRAPRASSTPRRLLVILGDQLDHRSLLLDDADPARDTVLMMEVREESTHVPSHKQRTTLFLSAMRHFAADLRARGLRVRYVALDDAGNTHSFASEVPRALRELAAAGEPVAEVRTVVAGDWRVRQMVEGWERDTGVPVTVLPDRHFLTQPEDFARWAEGKRSWTMEFFYRWQRQRLNILVDDRGQPEGGVWNLDKDNRESFGPAGPPPGSVPRPITFAPDAITREVMALVQRELPGNPGTLDSFAWPVTRAQALDALRDFIEHRLPLFGPYEDAMASREPVLYHSALSSALNLKLLDPRECVAAALDAYAAGRAPLQSVEGFVRQLIGWREFIRCVYDREGPSYRERNSLGHDGRLPHFYWTGDTDMACLRQCAGEVVESAWGHHIQRLMVLGNFALLAGVHAGAINDWFLAMYVDAVDWATTPNVVGMSQHADARPGSTVGVVGTKPYVSGGAYINRMSDYCARCRYDPARRTDHHPSITPGSSAAPACPFSAMYWDFLRRHRETLSRNPRVGPVLKNLDRFGAEEWVQITASAARVRERTGVTPPAAAAPAPQPGLWNNPRFAPPMTPTSPAPSADAAPPLFTPAARAAADAARAASRPARQTRAGTSRPGANRP